MAIKTAILEVLKKIGLPEVDFAVEHPVDMSHGDYATNVAMTLGKQTGKTPRELAKEISSVLAGKLPDIEKIEVAGAGFINFLLKRDFFAEQINKAVKEGENWGNNERKKSQLVLVEYTSPNLFKPLHVGNLVGNIIGESLTRLYEFPSYLKFLHRLERYLYGTTFYR